MEEVIKCPVCNKRIFDLEWQGRTVVKIKCFQCRPFFLTKIDGVGSTRQTVNTFQAPQQDGAFYISSTVDMRNITLEGTVVANTPEVAYEQRKRLLRVFTPKKQPSQAVTHGRWTASVPQQPPAARRRLVR